MGFVGLDYGRSGTLVRGNSSLATSVLKFNLENHSWKLRLFRNFYSPRFLSSISHLINVFLLKVARVDSVVDN